MGNVSTYRKEVGLENNTLQSKSLKEVLTDLGDKLEEKKDINSINIRDKGIEFVYNVDGNIKFDCSLEAKISGDILVFDGELSQEWTKTAQFSICATLGCAIFFMMVSQNKADAQEVKDILDSCIRDMELEYQE